MKNPSFEGLSIRAAIFLGFGLILGLWLFAWVQLSLRIADAQAREVAINSRYMAAQDALSNIRNQVLTGSVTLRDAMLDPDPGKIGEYRQELEQIYKSIDAQLRAYVPVSDSGPGRDEFRRLGEEVDSFQGTMLDVLESDNTTWREEAGRVLRLRVTPKRDIVLAVSDGVQSLNRAGYVQQQSEIAAVYRAVQRELWQLLGLALAIGVGVAVLAVVYASRLERRIRSQMAKDLELTRDLQQLSEKLVTAQEQERRHIARELHDEVGQALTAIKVELALAQHSIDGLAGPANLLRDARSITDGALHQVRDLSYLLHPAALDALGLVAAVDSFTNTFAKRFSIDAQLTHTAMTGRLSLEIETAAYRIIQEALTNVARHARATECRVELALVDGALRITIEDNGGGFDLAEVRTASRKGVGLIGIRERTGNLGGTLRFDSAPGRGTRLVISLPARERPADDGSDPLPDPTAA